MRNVEDLKSLCAYCQLRINPYMFNYCLSVAILHRSGWKPDHGQIDRRVFELSQFKPLAPFLGEHVRTSPSRRPDTKGMNIPTFAETFPDKFIDPKAGRKAREIAAVEESGSRVKSPRRKVLLVEVRRKAYGLPQT
ncbi:Phenoloxidase subunit 1 [Eumeta japonica]|uniref:Phenoloxidase subunit 1 n=1 Tax=Eumeta variegata TaxID=151549 RepID=A0A4C1U3W8_EUMVA|nr:Phenoloxidase subunit 1 [Eumeta japonica]